MGIEIDLSGKRALITGSSDGIGFAIAKAMLQANAEVVLNGREARNLDRATAELKPAGGTVRSVASDIATKEGCATLTREVPEVDIFVHNAAIFVPRDFFETTDELWEQHWQLNVMAGVRLSRHYLPKMAAKKWGRALFLASESAFNIPVEMIQYGVSKTADVALARGLAKRMTGTGVTVNSLLPGPTFTAGMKHMLEKQHPGASEKELLGIANQFVKTSRSSSILQRVTTVEEVANMAVYLCSPLASGTTGASVRVDGGVVDSL